MTDGEWVMQYTRKASPKNKNRGVPTGYAWTGKSDPTMAAPDGQWYGYAPRQTEDALTTLINNAAAQVASNVGNEPIQRYNFLQQLYGKRDQNPQSQTNGQLLPLDPNFLALLNNREILPERISTVRPVDPQMTQNAQQARARKLAFMTGGYRGMPAGPPMARDNGQTNGG